MAAFKYGQSTKKVILVAMTIFQHTRGGIDGHAVAALAQSMGQLLLNASLAISDDSSVARGTTYAARMGSPVNRSILLSIQGETPKRIMIFAELN